MGISSTIMGQNMFETTKQSYIIPYILLWLQPEVSHIIPTYPNQSYIPIYHQNMFETTMFVPQKLWMTCQDASSDHFLRDVDRPTWDKMRIQGHLCFFLGFGDD